jgi:hypothetical protein
MLGEAYKTIFYYGEQINNAETACLSLFISQNSFMYAVSESNFISVSELGHFEFISSGNSVNNISDQVILLVQNQLLHQKKFKKVNIAILNADFTLVPQAYALSGDAKPLLQFATGLKQIKNTLVHHLDGIDFCFTSQPELISYLEKTFTNASIRHAGAITIHLLFSQHSLLQSQLFLTIGDGFMELAAKDNNKLLFYNVFHFESDEDILYYLLFTMEQFSLNPLYVNLSIAAQRPINDVLIKNIKKYIKTVNAVVHDSSIKLNGDLNHLPQHYYFTLLNQHLCEL